MAKVDTQAQVNKWMLTTHIYNTTAANTTNLYTIPSASWGGMNPGSFDPLNPPPPRPETEKEWLRRRVNETLWRAA
jgi:hypothetical protein